VKQTTTSNQQNRDLRERMRCSPLPMWIFDRDTLEILEVNAAAVSVYGYSFREFLSQTIVFLRPPEQVPLILHRTLQDKIACPSTNEVWTHRRADGSTFSVSITSEWLLWNDRRAELVTAAPV
jgi:PAS domain S-box-containing protein